MSFIDISRQLYGGASGIIDLFGPNVSVISRYAPSSYTSDSQVTAYAKDGIFVNKSSTIVLLKHYAVGSTTNLKLSLSRVTRTLESTDENGVKTYSYHWTTGASANWSRYVEDRPRVDFNINVNALPLAFKISDIGPSDDLYFMYMEGNPDYAIRSPQTDKLLSASIAVIPDDGNKADLKCAYVSMTAVHNESAFRTNVLPYIEDVFNNKRY